VDGEEVRAEAGLVDGGKLAEGPLALLPGQALGRREPLHDDLAEGPGEEVGRQVGDDVLEDEAALLGDVEGPGQGVLGRVAEAAQGQGLLAGAEELHPAEEPVALGRIGDLLLDGVEEDEPLGAGQVLDRVGPDDGQGMEYSPVVPELGPDIEVARRDLPAEVGQARLLARPTSWGHVPLVRVPLSVPVPGPGSRRSSVRDVDHDQSPGVADLPAVEDLHEVRVALARLDQEDQAPAAQLELAAEQGLEAAPRREALPLAPAVDVADVGQGRGREPLARRPAGRLLERDAPLAPAVDRMQAQRHEHGSRSPLTSSATPS
jgi:hypothetical protein